MTSFYTRTGDEGTTGLLGQCRISKADLRMEAIGAVDEATANIGFARSLSSAEGISETLVQVQRDLYGLMAEVAAVGENQKTFHTIDENRVKWLEDEIEKVTALVKVPREFILPGDTPASGAMDIARTVVRRAERKVAAVLERGDITNAELLRYLNRLSSLIFILELREIQAGSGISPTLAKGKKKE